MLSNDTLTRLWFYAYRWVVTERHELEKMNFAVDEHGQPLSDDAIRRLLTRGYEITKGAVDNATDVAALYVQIENPHLLISTIKPKIDSNYHNSLWKRVMEARRQRNPFIP